MKHGRRTTARMREMGDARLALSVVLVVHFVLLVSALLLRLQEIPSTEPPALLLLDLRAETENDALPSLIPQRLRAVGGRKPRAVVNVGTDEQSPAADATELRTNNTEEQATEPANAAGKETGTVRKDSSRKAPRSVLDGEMSPAQATDELFALLEKHPEFRKNIVRQMLAGDGAVRPEPKFHLYLEEMLAKEQWKSSWEYELAKKTGVYFGPRDPVHGNDRDKKTGLQINPFELLKFLKGLIGGSDK